MTDGLNTVRSNDRAVPTGNNPNNLELASPQSVTDTRLDQLVSPIQSASKPTGSMVSPSIQPADSPPPRSCPQIRDLEMCVYFDAVEKTVLSVLQRGGGHSGDG